MRFFKRGKTAVSPPDAPQLPVTIKAAAGTAGITFSGPVINSHRQLLDRLRRRSPLPAVLGLTATLREEGVTYSALALGATWAADTDAAICVVELNWYWPGLQNLVKETASPGVAGVLNQEATLEEALIATNLPNLHLLPAGEMPLARRPGAARGKPLPQTITMLKERFDCLLLDIPAILAVSDAVPLAALSDTVCLVIKQGVTTIESSKRALDEIAHLPIAGVILNQVAIKTPQLLLRYIPQE